MQHIVSIGNMEDASDSWAAGNPGTNRIAITGTRSIGSIIHTIRVIVDLGSNKIWTGIPISGNVIKENPMVKYYWELPWSNFLALTQNQGQSP